MPTYTFTSPEGKSYKVNGPEGSNKEQAFKILQRQLRASGQAPKPAPSRGFGELVRDGAQATAQAVRGQTDRKDVRGVDINKDFSTTPHESLIRAGAMMFGPIGMMASQFAPFNEDQARLRAAQLTTVDDETYGNVVRKTLGDRLVGGGADAQGNEIVKFKQPDGSIAERFVNEPGLDAGDVERSIAFSAPFAVSGGTMAAATRGASLTLRSLAQGVAGANTSIAQDVGANLTGAEQDVSPSRAAIAAAGGVVGEQLVGRLGRFIQKRMRNREVFGSNGALTPALEKRVRQAGLDDAGVQQLEQLLKNNKELNIAADPMEAFRKNRAEQIGVNLTKGQRTRDVKQLQNEEQMANAVFGDNPADAVQSQQFQKFKMEAQPAQVQKAATDFGTELRGGTQQIDPSNPNELGASIGSGVQKAKAALKAEEKAAWKPVQNFTATETELGGLPTRLREGIGEMVGAIGTDQTPATNAALDSLNNFVTGKATTTHAALGGAGSRTTVTSMRKQLSQLQRGAQTPTDKASMRGLVDGYEKWLDDMVEGAQAAGADPTRAVQINALRTAREQSRAIKSITSPKNAQDVAGKRLQKIFEGDDLTAEEILDQVVGNVDAKARPQTKQTLVRLKRAMTRGGAPEAWNDIKAAYWARLVTPAKPTLDTYGKIGLKNPNMIRKSIRSAMQQQESVMRTLFEPEELRHMRNFAAVAEDLTTTVRDGTGSLNPSGTSFSIARMGKKFAHQWLGMMEARANFSVLSGENVGLRKAKAAAIGGLKNSPIFGDVATGAAQGVRSSDAERAMSQALRGRIAPSSNGAGAMVSASDERPGSMGLRDLGRLIQERRPN